MIITQKQGSVQPLEEQLRATQEQLRTTQEQLRETEYRDALRSKQYELERVWWEDLMQNTWLSGDHKLVLYTIRHIIQALRYDWDQPTCDPVLIYSKEIQGKTGLSEVTVCRCTKQLHKAGLISKVTKREGKISKCWYTLHGKICHSARNVQIDAPVRNHGGARCRKCGSKNINIKTVHVCLDCGHEEDA